MADGRCGFCKERIEKVRKGQKYCSAPKSCRVQAWQKRNLRRVRRSSKSPISNSQKPTRRRMSRDEREVRDLMFNHSWF